MAALTIGEDDRFTRDAKAQRTAGRMKKLMGGEVDKKLVTHDVILRDIYDKLRPLLTPPPDPPRRQIGFHAGMKRD